VAESADVAFVLNCASLPGHGRHAPKSGRSIAVLWLFNAPLCGKRNDGSLGS